MSKTGDWGRDPSVRTMRRLFSRMESAQKALLEKLEIPPFDSRLRDCREDSRNLFERALSLSATKGMGQGEDDATDLYMHCLTWALNRHGIRFPAEAIPGDNQIEALIQEALR